MKLLVPLGCIILGAVWGVWCAYVIPDFLATMITSGFGGMLIGYTIASLVRDL